MGKKKPKDPEATATTNDVVSPPPDVFKSLFGNAQPQNDAVSIFSEDNPFCRKPQDQTLEPSGNPSHGGLEDIDGAELKKRKRKEEKASLGSDSETPLEGKKLRKEELQNSQEEQERIEEKKNKKKKRKRDELEQEYEARKYGVEVGAVEDEGNRLGGKVGEKRKTVDNPADMLISKEGFDDENKLLRTVFVGNLPLTMKKKALIKEFSQFGDVESVRIRSVPITDVSVLASTLVEFRVLLFIYFICLRNSSFFID